MISGLWLFLSIASVAASVFFIVLLVTKHKYSMKQLELESKKLDKGETMDLDARLTKIESQLSDMS